MKTQKVSKPNLDLSDLQRKFVEQTLGNEIAKIIKGGFIVDTDVLN